MQSDGAPGWSRFRVRRSPARDAGAGLETFLFVSESLSAEIKRMTRNGHAFLGGGDFSGGGCDGEGDILFESHEIGFGLAQGEFGGPGASAVLRKGQRHAEDETG